MAQRPLPYGIYMPRGKDKPLSRNLRSFACLLLGAGALVLASAGPAVAGADILYNQTDSAATPNTNPGLPNYSPSNFFSVANYNRTADDFTVPAGATWSIHEVDAAGAYNANPGSVVNVYIYPDASGHPGTAFFTQEGITASGGPNYQVPLTGVPNLTAGQYWITVQQDASLGGGYWSWGTRSVQSGAAAQWFRNVFGPGPSCSTNVWTLRAACWPPGNPDQTFALKGTNLTPPPPPVATKPANTARPRIKGRADVGSKLKVSLGAWTGSAPITYKEQWKSCNAKGKRCKNIKGATKRAFRLSSKYIGHRLVVSVSASNSAGSGRATSKPSKVVTR